MSWYMIEVHHILWLLNIITNNNTTSSQSLISLYQLIIIINSGNIINVLPGAVHLKNWIIRWILFSKHHIIDINKLKTISYVFSLHIITPINNIHISHSSYDIKDYYEVITINIPVDELICDRSTSSITTSQYNY